VQRILIPDRWCRAFFICVAGLLALLGVAAWSGWQTGNVVLVQFHPVFAPIHPLSALGLLALSVGWFGLAWRRVWPARIHGALAAAIGLASVLQWIEVGDLGLDRLAPGGTAALQASLTARVALSTGFGFFLAGVGLVLAGALGPQRRPSPWLGILGSALLILGVLGLAGYVFGFARLSQRDAWIRMALHEALAFCATGLALVLQASRQISSLKNAFFRWLPAGVSTCCVAFAVTLWQGVGAQDHARIERLVQAEAARVQQQLQNDLPGQFVPLVQVAGRWGPKGKPADDKLADDAGNYIGQHPGCLAVAWVDANGRFEWLESVQEARHFEEVLFAEGGQGQAFLAQARGRSETTLGRAAEGAGQRRSLLLGYVPIPGAGGLLAVFRLQEMLDAVLNANVAPGFAVSIDEGQRTVYSRLTAEKVHRAGWERHNQVQIGGMAWQVHTWPTPEVMDKERFSLPKWGLAFGFLLIALLALAVRLARTAHRRAQALEAEMAERHLAAKALRASEAKYRSLIENLEQSVFLKDRELHFIAANKQFCQSLGCDEAAIVGKTDFDFFPPDLAEKYRTDDRVVMAEGKRMELEEQNPLDGKLRTVRVVKTPVRDDQGHIIGVLGIFWDVTQERALGLQLRQAQKMEAIGQLAGGIAHDFNNLLTAIMGNLSLMSTRMPTTDPSREFALAAEQASHRAAHLTKQLLGFSRRTLLCSQPTDIKIAMDEVIDILRRTIDPRIHVEVKAAADVWRVQADPTQLNQVLMNLCLNARDAMPEGGYLRLESKNMVLDESDVRMSLEARPGEFVCLRVSDTGHGIPREVRPRIFEPFFTTKGPGQGTGLGLAMVFGIVKQHRGWIDCYSEVNEGTRFDIYLPRATGAAPSTVPAPPPAPPRQGHETILLADDEPMIRNLGRTILEQLGYQVLLAVDGQEAVDIYAREKERIDLVILDLTMPRLSGHDALRRMLTLDPKVCVLFASGYSAEQISEADKDSILGFIGKPYRPNDLAVSVRAALDRCHAVRKRVVALDLAPTPEGNLALMASGAA
jgi:PAS domain S-box-containing protein